MTEHLTQQDIEAVHRRTISAADRSRVDKHIAMCDACLQSVVQPDYAFAALGEAFLPVETDTPFHLSRAELQTYVRGAGDEADRIIYESHLEDCPECAGSARDLAAADLLQTTSSDKDFPAVPWRTRLTSLWPSFGHLTPIRVAAVVAVLGALLVVTLIWQRQRRGDESQQVVRETPTQTPDKSSEQVTPTPDQPETPDKRLAVILKDKGNEVGLDQEGKLFGLERVDPDTRQRVAGVLAGRSLPKPKDLDELAAPPIALMDGSRQPESFRLISPVGVVTTDDRPTLRWQALPGAASYTVSVFDKEFNQIATSAPQSGTTWVVKKRLPRGGVYSWQVKALKDGQEITSPVAPAPRAQFKVLEPEKLQALTKLRQQQSVSHLAMGVTYAKFGLLSEAEREFELLLKANPDSAVAKKLLRSVQEWK